MAIPAIVLLGGAVVFLLAATSGKKKTAATTTSAESGNTLPQEQQVQLALALQNLKANANGGVDGPVDSSAIAQANTLAASFEEKGYLTAANVLRGYAKQAAAWVPTKTQVTVTGLDAATLEKINRALQFEGSPKVLREIAASLRSHPLGNTAEAQNLILMLEAMATQKEAQAKTSDAIIEIDKAIKKAEPLVIVTPPVDIVVPVTPTPQPAPKAKTPREIAADTMITSLSRVQSQYATVKAAKGKEDKSIVSKFQKLAGLKQDGLTGPGTLLAAAQAGITQVLPLVMYWPKSATAKNVLAYRSALLTEADKAESTGDTMRASALRNSAARERGQAGIVDSMPA